MTAPGPAQSAWRWLRCKVAGHSGYDEEWEHEERGGLKIRTLVRRDCSECGRPLIAPVSAVRR